MSTRSSRSYPQSSAGRQGSSKLKCNRCSKVLSATVFLLSCDCIYCEACTYEHFNTSSTCPSCRKTLRHEDLMELCIAEPSLTQNEYTKQTLQTILTKCNKGSMGMGYHEACSRLMHEADSYKRASRFLMKQFLRDSNKQESKSGDIGRAYAQSQEDNARLQQSLSDERLKYERETSGMQRQNQVLQTSLDEAKVQLEKIRMHFANSGMARLPSSSHSHSSSSTGKRSIGDHPPIKGFLLQKQAREQAVAMERRRGPTMPDNITPIQLPPSSHHHHHRPGSHGRSQQTAMVSAPPTPRIRDLSSGYVFSGRNSSGNSGGPSGGGKYHHHSSGHQRGGYGQENYSNYRR